MKILAVLRSFLMMVLLLCGVQAYADTIQNPVDFVQSIVNQLQARVNGHQDALRNNPKQLYAIVQEVIMPNVDINEMAGLALGPKWRTATAAQQEEFVNQFSYLLTKSYANALLSISDYQIIVNPMRTTAWQTNNTISVNSQVVSRVNGDQSHLVYYLERSGGAWKIYDLAIEGVSFLKDYQSQFSSFKDMNSILVRLRQLNGQGPSNG